MENKLSKLRPAVYEIFCAALMILTSYPAMKYTGKLGLQITITVTFTFFAAIIFEMMRVDLKIVAHSVCAALIFWTLLALLGQMVVKKTLLIFATPWVYMFYYDCIGMVILSVIVMTAYFRVRAQMKKSRITADNYRQFYRIVSVAFTVFFILVLLYCFFLCRTPDTQRPTPHLTPFAVFKWTFLSGYFDYERLVLFFGNIAIFVPMGYLLYKRKKGRVYQAFLIFFPIVLSVSIELSQYFFKMGDPDVDDVILNMLGFYLGIALKRIFDKLFPLDFFLKK